jgi:hypothetical protein
MCRVCNRASLLARTVARLSDNCSERVVCSHSEIAVLEGDEYHGVRETGQGTGTRNAVPGTYQVPVPYLVPGTRYGYLVASREYLVRGVPSDARYKLCRILRTSEEVLTLPGTSW